MKIINKNIKRRFSKIKKIIKAADTLYGVGVMAANCQCPYCIASLKCAVEKYNSIRWEAGNGSVD